MKRRDGSESDSPGHERRNAATTTPTAGITTRIVGITTRTAGTMIRTAETTTPTEVITIPIEASTREANHSPARAMPTGQLPTYFERPSDSVAT